MKALVVEDDLDALDLTTYVLRREGYTVVGAADGKQALQRWEKESPDLVILDVKLPKVNGFEILRRIRIESSVPVIMVTGRGEDEDVLRGLGLGADDYVIKPFSYRQLLARIRTALRHAGLRQPALETDHLIVGELIVNTETHEVTSGGRSVRLTPLEYRLLYCLVSNSGRLMSTDRLTEYVWGIRGERDASLLKTHICHLRRKLGVSPGKAGYIKNVPGVGYSVV